MEILTDNNKKRGHSKELIIGYKTIYINVYNILVMDITTNDECSLLYRHESFQLWESECTSLLLKD